MKAAASKGGAQVQKLLKNSGLVHLNQPNRSSHMAISQGWEPTGFLSGESILPPIQGEPLSADLLRKEITSDFGFPKSQLHLC